MGEPVFLRVIVMTIGEFAVIATMSEDLLAIVMTDVVILLVIARDRALNPEPQVVFLPEVKAEVVDGNVMKDRITPIFRPERVLIPRIPGIVISVQPRLRRR